MMSKRLDELTHKINIREALVAVIGLGYVGLPIAVQKSKAGFNILGVEQQKTRANMINSGQSYIRDVNEKELKELVNKGKIIAETDFRNISRADIILICVPTPLTKYREPNITYIINVSKEISKRLQRGQLIVLESTTYPGTTQEIILPILQETGLEVGQDFFLAYSPERVDPGNKRYNTQNTTRVIGGITSTCLEAATDFYKKTIKQVVPVSSPAIAEMTKVFENTYRAVNIALVNELMLLCNRMNIDVWEVVEAAGTKPFGIQTFYPGPGVGGHCIPIDPFYLTWKAREYNFHTRFIELAGELNIEVSYYVVDKVIEALNKHKKPLNGSKILVLGVAYKKDIPDVRESPATRIIPQLIQRGAEVLYHDPYVPYIEPKEMPEYTSESIELTEDIIKQADCVLIITDHSNVDYEWVADNAQVIVDTRNALKDADKRENIVKI